MTLVTPRIVNNVSCVKRIDHEGFCVAGAALGEVHALLFVAGAALGEFLNVSRGAKCCVVQ